MPAQGLCCKFGTAQASQGVAFLWGEDHVSANGPAPCAPPGLHWTSTATASTR
jgi:hypothetical protein